MVIKKEKSNVKAMKGNPKSLIGKGFDKNPQNINKTGANRKTIAVVNIELESQGYTAANQKDIIDCYMRLVNIDIPQLSIMINDATQPAMVRIVGKSIVSGKGFDVIETMLNRGIGKAVNNVDVKSDGKEIATQQVFVIGGKEFIL
jgi:hypothetical protein